MFKTNQCERENPPLPTDPIWVLTPPLGLVTFGWVRLGSVMFGYVGLCWVQSLQKRPSKVISAWSFLQFQSKLLVSHKAFYKFTGNSWFRIQLS